MDHATLTKILDARNNSPIYFSTLGPNLLYNTSVHRCTPHTAQCLQVTRSPLCYLRASRGRGEVCWQRIAAQPSLVSSRPGQPLPFSSLTFCSGQILQSESKSESKLDSTLPCGWLPLAFGNVEAPRKLNHPNRPNRDELVPDLDR